MSGILVLATDCHTRGGIQQYTHHLVSTLHELCGFEAVRTLFLWKGMCAPRFSEKVRFAISAAIERWRVRPSLVISTHVGIARVAFLLKKMFRVPYLVLAHGDEVWGEAPSYALREADIVLSVSRFTAERLVRRHGVDAHRIRVLRPAVSPELFQSPISPECVRERHGLHGKRVLLTVGRLVREARYKGYESVLHALVRIRRLMPTVAYVIVGDGDDRPRLERLARDLGVGDMVHFAGAVEDAWLAAYYGCCDLFVMPSQTRLTDPCHGEGFGIVYLEAAAFGKPAIAGREGGSAEAVLDGVTGVLVDPSDPEEIARAALDLLRDESRRARLGQAARARVLREFTCERFRQDVEAILRECGYLTGREPVESVSAGGRRCAF